MPLLLVHTANEQRGHLPEETWKGHDPSLVTRLSGVSRMTAHNHPDACLYGRSVLPCGKFRLTRILPDADAAPLVCL